MTHLLVHLVKEISILDPVFLHNMFPFERFMRVLKKYVHNQYGMITMDLNNIGYKDEPFVLAKDVNQVFYVNDMSTKLKREKKQ